MGIRREDLHTARVLLRSPKGLLGLLALGTLAVHLVVAMTTAYGLHRDEYLYLAYGRHLDWGFIEAPPGIALVAAGLQSTLGTSLVAVRLVPALAHSVLVFLTGLLTRELGGTRFAILVAGVAALIAPVYLRAGTLFQPVPFDQLAWAAAAFFLARRIRRDDGRQWLGVGLACGLGLVFKYTILVFGAGLALGLLLTSLRRDLTTPWPWTGAALAGLFAMPNLLWQAAHEWPLLRHAQALSESQLVHVARLDFVVEQVLMLHPLTLPLWGAGLVFFFTRRGKPFRVLGWAYVVCFALLLTLQGKPYYLAPAYPMLLAGGAVVGARLVRQWHPRLLRPLVAATLLGGGMALAPLGMPVLPPPAMARYLDAIGASPESETGKAMQLPQDYADMLGWPEMARAAGQVYHSLPPDDRERVLLFGESYGHAGVLDYHRSELGLPPAASASGSYYLWGPGEPTGAVTLYVGVSEDEVADFFDRCTTETVVRHPWAREAAAPILVCRGPDRSFQALWPSLDPW
jgi:hypothetical protein